MSGQKHTGFTIVELLIVIVVIAILAAITIVAYNGVSQRAHESTVQSAAQQARSAVLAYMVQHADTPPTSLAAAGVPQSDETSFSYSYTQNSFCITATESNYSAYTNNTNQTSPVTGTCPVVNIAQNPSFEGTGGFPRDTLPVSGAGYTWARSTTRTHSGSTSLSVAAPATVADRYVEHHQLVSVPAGTYRVSIWVYLTGAGATYQDRQVWLTCSPGGCGPMQNLTYDKTKLNQWQRVSGTIIATQTANIWLRLYGPVSSTTYFDDIMITQGSTLHTYADGNSAGWSWDGATNSSTSRGPAL